MPRDFVQCRPQPITAEFVIELYLFRTVPEMYFKRAWYSCSQKGINKS